MEDPLRRLPGYSLRRAASAMLAELSGLLVPLELRFADVSAMMVITANPGITASQLGRVLDIQRANMVPLVARIEEAGLLVRAPLDGKRHSLALTEAGKLRLERAVKVIEAFEASLLERIPEEHRDHLKPALDALWR